jgi:hypothetical protein
MVATKGTSESSRVKTNKRHRRYGGLPKRVLLAIIWTVSEEHDGVGAPIKEIASLCGDKSGAHGVSFGKCVKHLERKGYIRLRDDLVQLTNTGKTKAGSPLRNTMKGNKEKVIAANNEGLNPTQTSKQNEKTAEIIEHVDYIMRRKSSMISFKTEKCRIAGCDKESAVAVCTSHKKRYYLCVHHSKKKFGLPKSNKDIQEQMKKELKNANTLKLFDLLSDGKTRSHKDLAATLGYNRMKEWEEDYLSSLVSLRLRGFITSTEFRHVKVADMAFPCGRPS